MKIYSIEKVGNEYVVKVDDQSVIKVGSRRRAAQLVVDASGLLDEVPLAPQMVAASDCVLTVDTMSATDDAASATENDPASGGIMPSSITRDSPEDA